MAQAHIKQDAERVLANFDGKVVDLPWQAALELGRALVSAAKLAEEHAKHGMIIADSAILMRAGAPFSLSSNSKIMDAAKVEAAHNRDLRRYMPGGVKSREAFGLPAVFQTPPTPIGA